jgi:uncharacterized protein YaaQ
MYLLFAIIQDEDADLLSKRLNSAGIRLTRLNTIGGFLARGNVTVLAGIRRAEMDTVLDIIRKTCRTRKRYINPTPTGTEPAHLALTAPALPLEVLVGGATIFAFPVHRFCRLPGGEAAPLSDERFAEEDAEPASGGTNPMNLVLSIVANEDADQVTRALIAGGYRVTRMNTAGGFFRRGNVTLLVGVEEPQVDDVLSIINKNCRARTEAQPIEKGMPSYGATVFVLEADRFVRV